jgi:CTP synthase (UTP-ammonia lyase)
MKKIALVAEWSPTSENHRATEEALRHSSDKLGVKLDYEWVMTSSFDPACVTTFDGIWLTTGEYRNRDAVMEGVRIAREAGIPSFGTCSGFQFLVLSLARDLLGIAGGSHEEYDPDGGVVIVSRLACSLRGREMTIALVEGTRVQRLYGAMTAGERYYCQFGVNPEFVDRFRSSPVRIAGSDAEGVIRILELPDHPFFIGTLFVPQRRSTPGATHPLIDGFVQAVE